MLHPKNSLAIALSTILLHSVASIQAAAPLAGAGAASAAVAEATSDKGSTRPMTRLLYLEDTYKFEGEGVLLEKGTHAKGNYLIFDQTIFYPQGGGQPSDLGVVTLENGFVIPITFVGFEEGRVLHFYDHTATPVDDSLLGLKANYKVDADRRLLNAKAHSAGHLIGSLVGELIAPELTAAKGYHFSPDCYVEFEGVLSSKEPAVLLAELNRQLAEVIAKKRMVSARLEDPTALIGLKLPRDYTIPAGKPCRVVHAEGLAPVPCGGTHVRDFSIFTEITATKLKNQAAKGLLRISYSFR